MEPMLRFKADDGSEFPAWEEKTLGEVFTEIKEKNRSELPVLSVQQGAGTVLRDSSERRIAYNKNSLNNYKAMRKGDFIIHLRSFEGGLECSNHDGISSPAYHILRSNMILSDAFKDYFRSYAFIKGKLSDAVVGIRDGKNIDMPTFWEIQMSIPSLPEQRKIADFLSAVDAVIAAQQAEVDAWEQRKKGVMQKLFSQEVRFKADDGSEFPDWTKTRLNKLCEYGTNHGTGRNYIGTENLLKDFGGVAVKNGENEGTGSLYEPGDTLMSNIRPYLKKVWTADCEGACSTDVLVFHPTNVVPDFLHYVIASDAFVAYVMSAAKGSKMPRGDKAHIMQMPVFVPDKDEQRKISDCLASMDEVIQKSKGELAKWQELKKGLLQQMFV